MLSPVSIVQQFIADVDSVDAEETVETYVASVCRRNVLIPTVDGLTHVLSLLSDRDTVTIDVQLGEQDPASVTWPGGDEVSRFVDELRMVLDVRDEDDEICVRITIQKRVREGLVSVYDVEAFSRHLSALPCAQLLGIFSNLVEQEGTVTFACCELPQPLWSSTFAFLPDAMVSVRKPPATGGVPNRARVLERIGSICHFQNASKFCLLPEDFFVDMNGGHVELRRLFDRLCVVCCICSLLDTTRVSGDSLEFRLNGYRVKTGSVAFSDVATESARAYYEIYRWLYGGGDLADKSGLCRNVLSLHMDEGSPCVLKGRCFDSVRSGYAIYLRENVAQYIEVKNKLSEFLFDTSQRANKIVDEFTSSFSKSMLGVVSFTVSVILVRLIGDKALDDLLPPRVVLFACALLAISLAHMVVSVVQLNRRSQRYKDAYFSLKARYADLLNEDDIESIFDRDIAFDGDLTFIRGQRNLHCWLWGGSILLFLTVLLVSPVIERRLGLNGVSRPPSRAVAAPDH